MERQLAILAEPVEGAVLSESEYQAEQRRKRLGRMFQIPAAALDSDEKLIAYMRARVLRIFGNN